MLRENRDQDGLPQNLAEMVRHPEGKHVYKLEVEGTAITEFYEFESPISEDEAAQIWFQDMKENSGPALARTYRDRIKCKKLTEDDPELEEYLDDR